MKRNTEFPTSARRFVYLLECTAFVCSSKFRINNNKKELELMLYFHLERNRGECCLCSCILLLSLLECAEYFTVIIADHCYRTKKSHSFSFLFQTYRDSNAIVQCICIEYSHKVTVIRVDTSDKKLRYTTFVKRRAKKDTQMESHFD